MFYNFYRENSNFLPRNIFLLNPLPNRALAEAHDARVEVAAPIDGGEVRELGGVGAHQAQVAVAAPIDGSEVGELVGMRTW